MATVRYTVPPGGGFFNDVPGIWQGGDVFDFDPDTRQVTLVEPAAAPAAEAEPAAASTAEAVPATPAKKSATKPAAS